MKPSHTVVAVGVLLIVALAAELGAAQSTPGPAPNGTDNSFGRIDMPPHPTYEAGSPVGIEAIATMRPDSGFENATFILIALNLHSDHVAATLESVTGPDGEQIPYARDERQLDPRQPKFHFYPHQLPPAGTPIHIRGTAEPRNNGQFHVGAMIIAFDEWWGMLTTPQGDPAQLYAFSLVKAEGLERGPLQAPFEGSGNIPGVGLLAALGALLVLAAWRRRSA